MTRRGFVSGTFRSADVRLAGIMDQFAAETLDHVAVTVTDVAGSKLFYSGVLGLRELPRPSTFDFPGAWFAIGSSTIHLLGRPQPDTSSPRHFCLWVADVRAAARKVESSGCRVEWHSKHKIPGVDRFFTYDPDGNRIEVQGRDDDRGASAVP